MALYWLFWWFESIGARMDVINDFAIKYHILVFR